MKRNFILKLACLILISNFITAQENSNVKLNSSKEYLLMTESIAPTKEKKMLAPVGPTTEITFEQAVFNFGEIAEGELIKNVFVFTNTGTEPLLILNAKGSCGCTVPEYPKEPILPGEQGQLLVVFNTKGKKGSLSKRVTLTSNTDPVNTYLNIKGTVLANDNLQNAIAKRTKGESTIRNKEIDPSLFTVFPNPSSEIINISMKEHDGQNGEISIFSKDGKIVDHKIIQKIDQPSYSFSVINYPKGIYTATMKVGDKMRIARQFVIQ